jgi:hypothetical protein
MTQAFPSSILLLETWPQCILPSATVIFFDSNGQQFLSIADVYINKQQADGCPLISPAFDNTGDLLFGTLQHFTTMPPTMIATTFCKHIRGFVDAGQVHSFPRPPRVLRTLHFTGILPATALATSLHAHGPRLASTTYDYHISGYFGSCHYALIFTPMDSDFGQANDVLGRLLIQIKAIPGGTRRPTYNINTWRMFQREDALTGKGGGDVMRLMEAPQPRGKGPTVAQQGGAP